MAATDLITLDSITSVNVNAAAVSTITGTAANVKTVVAADTITKGTNYSVTLSDSSVSVTDLNAFILPFPNKFI